MKYKLQDLIDLEQFQSLLDRLSGIYPFPSAIIDNDGVILVATGWQDICTKFHRQNYECEKECIKSDQYILEHLAEANPAVSYRCPHGLIDNAMPIMVDGQHLGSFFTGQFFLEEPDLEYFREQAWKFGFDEDAYLEAVRKVPVWGREQLESYLAFIREMIDVLSSVGLKNLKSIEAAEALRDSEEKFRALYELSSDAVILLDENGLFDCNDATLQIFRCPSREEFCSKHPADFSPSTQPDGMDSMTLANERIATAMEEGSKNFEWIHRRMNGEDFPAEVLLSALELGGRRVLQAVVRDISERKRAEEKLRKSEARWRLSVENMIEGYALHEAIFDTSGRMVDFRYIEFNPAAQKIVGIAREDIIGKTAMTLFPNITERGLMARYAEVMATGESAYIDDFYYSGDILDKAFDISCIPIDDRHFVCVFQDVTERKRAEEALRESEYRWKFAVEGSGAGLWDWNVPENTVFYSQRWKEILGFEEDEIGNGLDEWANRIHPDDLATTMADVEAHLAGTKPFYSNEHRLVCKDGSWKWILDRGVVVRRDDTGNPLRMIGSHTDVTDRKKAEEALQESEARYRSLVEGAPGIVYSFSSLRGGTYYSPGTTEIIGYSPEELYAQPMLWRDSIHPDDLPLVEQGIRDALNGSGFCIEYRILDVQGRWHWLEDRSTECKASSNEIVIEGFVLDITERKQAESERERLMAAIEQVAETIVITDAEGVIQYVNPFFERTTGYTCEEAINQNPRILNSGEHDDAFYKEMWDTLKRGDVWTGRIINKKKDGTLFTEDATISPVRDASGATVNYVAVKRDVTHEIALTAQLRQSQKMEVVGQLAGGIAHDFNNLLQAILGYGYLALREVGEDRPAHAFIDEMMRAGELARTLVGQLLAFSRRQVLDMKDVNLNDSIANVLKMLRRVIGEHITLDVISSHDLGIVRADPGQIDQILMNLCVNARDAMGKSGKITIATENVQIDDEFCEACTWARPGRYVLLSVTDTGCGMDQETLGKIFEPFFTTKEVGKGTGLGLATVYGVVRQHEGLIHVHSELGKGTTFKIYLPLAARSSIVEGKKIEGSVPVGNETILLAEDNETLLKLTRMFLENAGYSVLTATDGQDALRIFEEHADKIDLALLDVMMPNLSGKAVCERIRENRPDFPFLFASGYSMGSLHDNFVLDEGLHLIQKPFRRDDLLRKVREVLDNGSAAPDEN